MIYSLSENIKRLRTAQGMNQVVFANKLGVTKQCVSNWENDNVLPSIEMLLKISEVFCVTTDYLLGKSSQALLDVSGLSDEQLAHISLIVTDLKKLNFEKSKERNSSFSE